MPDLLHVCRDDDSMDSYDLMYVDEEIVDVDLTKHIFRLCTQRLLYEARQYADADFNNEFRSVYRSPSGVLPAINTSNTQPLPYLLSESLENNSHT